MQARCKLQFKVIIDAREEFADRRFPVFVKPLKITARVILLIDADAASAAIYRCRSLKRYMTPSSHWIWLRIMAQMAM
jgi:hypothetical protein